MADFRVGFNPNVSSASPVKKAQSVEKKDEPAIQAQAPEVNYKPADEILNQMANSSLIIPEKKTEDVSGKKVIEVSRYVDADSAKRIAFAARECITALFSAEETAIKELGLSPKAAQTLAVDSFEQKYMA